MHNRFLSWAQEKTAKLRSRKLRSGQCPDGPKELLSPWASRSLALSPTPSSANLGASSTATLDSTFFQRLPPEIRRKILIAAFGDRTMHMSLQYDHSRQLVFNQSSGACQWERYLPPGTKYLPQMLRPDPKAPKAWNWRGCPCWYFNHEQTYDECLPGVARCWKTGTDVPDVCLIGAMGWLLSCRQAYGEGIEVLYTTNTFRLSNKDNVILHHLPTLLPTHRLSMITSIELNLCVYGVMQGPEHNDPHAASFPDSTRRGFRTLLEAIPRAFPRLHTVFLNIYGKLFPNLLLAERAPFYDQFLFEPIDNMVRKLGPELQEFTLAVPFTVSRKIMHRAVSQGVRFRRHGWHAIWWRPVTSGIKGISGQEEQKSGEMILEEGSGPAGYWITMGVFDNPYPIMGCFGSGSSDPELHDAINRELDAWTAKDEPRRVEEGEA